MENLKKKAAYIAAELETLYPEVECELKYKKPHELLIATRLSAQCTDKRVNLVTPVLFAKYGSIEEFAVADVSEVESIIRSCGLYKTKARDITDMCIILKDEYSSKIPDNMRDLLKLPGVGRKTANLILGELYGKPAVVTDTHVIRLSGRLGLVLSSEPSKVENELKAILPPSESLEFCHRIVWHGRRVCTARAPKCGACTLKKYCIRL